MMAVEFITPCTGKTDNSILYSIQYPRFADDTSTDYVLAGFVVHMAESVCTGAVMNVMHPAAYGESTDTALAVL